ncbi:MAG: tetratricopeptide repeat protein, partial [Pirellulales bacterium]
MVNRSSWLKKLLESRKILTRFMGPCLLVMISVSWTHTCHGQGSSGYPRNDYWLAMSVFHEGEFRSAATEFNRTSRVKSTDGEWIDSICHHAMLGECFYQMGQARQALQQYDQALNIFVANQQWIMRLYIPNVLPQSYRSTRKVTWGPSKRQMTLGKTPNTVSIFRGNLNNFAVIQQGGTVQPAMLTPMNAREIVRCTALAIRRRTEILGLTSRYSPLTQRVLGALELRPAPVNHWSQGWISLMLGLA